MDASGWVLTASWGRRCRFCAWLVGLSVLVGALLSAAPAHAAKRKPPACSQAFPNAHSRTIGRTTWYNRQRSVQMVTCDGFGLSPSADFPISADMVCGLVAQAIGIKAHSLGLFVDGVCSGAALAASPKEPAKYIGVACDWVSALIGKAVGALAAIGCTFAPSAGHALGGMIESKHELDIDADILNRGKCLKYSPTHFGSPWLAVKCSRKDRGFSTLRHVHPGPLPPQQRTVRIDWDTNQTDIDLHVWDPAGDEAWYQSQDGIPNGELSTDITTGFGPETFITTDTRTPLTIGVCYYAANTDDGSVPPTNVTVTTTEANGTQRVDHVVLNDVKQEDVVDSSPAGASAFAPNSGWCDSDNGGNNSGPANTLYAGQTLNPGASLLSPNHQYELIMQGDGNLVLYQAGSALWSSGTAGDSGATATMQADGNLVIYDGGVAKWNSGTNGSPGAVLVLQDDSNLVIYQGSTAIWDWSSGRLSPPPPPPPPPQPSISASKGGYYDGGYTLNVAVHNFPTGTFTYYCHDNSGPGGSDVVFYSHAVSVTDPNQSSWPGVFCYDSAPYVAYLVMDGYRSNNVQF